MTSTLVVIPARGGSQGIPRKNLAEVAGKPLVVWTIEQALAMSCAPRVVVSTDDPEIAEVSRRAGAEVIDRPAQLARHDTPTEPVVEHALDQLSASEFAALRAVVLLQATSPVRLPGTLDRALDQFLATGVDALVGVVPASPFLWSGDEQRGVPAYDVSARPRRQDFTEQPYRETGSVYLTKPWVYRELHNRLGGQIGLLRMTPDEGLDIDEPADLLIADCLLRHLGFAE